MFFKCSYFFGQFQPKCSYKLGSNKKKRVYRSVVGESVIRNIPNVCFVLLAVMIEMVMMVLSMCYTLKLHSMVPEDGQEIGYLMRNVVYDRLSFKFGIRKMSKSGKLLSSASRKESETALIGVSENANGRVETGRNLSDLSIIIQQCERLFVFTLGRGPITY